MTKSHLQHIAFVVSYRLPYVTSARLCNARDKFVFWILNRKIVALHDDEVVQVIVFGRFSFFYHPFRNWIYGCAYEWTYSDWLHTLYILITLWLCLGANLIATTKKRQNPRAHSFVIFSFIPDLLDHIRQGALTKKILRAFVNEDDEICYVLAQRFSSAVSRSR